MQIRGQRHVVLLEVLIAFILIVLCILPLIYPHVAIYRAEKQFIDTVKLDHDVNLLYGHILQKLHQNTIPFSDLENQVQRPVDNKLWEEAGIKEMPPFEGIYKFTIRNKKPLQPAPKMYLFYLDFTFVRKGAKENEDPLKYHYEIFVERKLSDADEEV
jgi:hypothetical protein